MIIKPDAIRRGITGAVLSRLEELRLEIVGAKMVQVSRALAEQHYQHLRDKPFFQELLDFLQGNLHGISAVLVFVLWGEQAVARVRALAGATHPEKADPTSIRGAFGRMTTSGLMENVIHASADPQEAEREIRMWFTPNELVQHPGMPGGPRKETART